MRASSLKIVLVASLVASLVSAPALSAQNPVQISLFDPIQIVKAGEGVDGVRLNVLYTKNTNVQYVDLGFGYNLTTGNGVGVQWAFISHTQGTFTGWQSGFVAVTEGMFTGLQESYAVNKAGTGKGVQFGAVNIADSWSGLQLGLVNVAGNMKGTGLQIGIINIIKTGGQFPVFPIANWTF